MTQVSFSATLKQIKTTPDGGWQLTLDIPESDANAMMDLSKLRDLLLSVGVVSNG